MSILGRMEEWVGSCQLYFQHFLTAYQSIYLHITPIIKSALIKKNKTKTWASPQDHALDVVTFFLTPFIHSFQFLNEKYIYLFFFFLTHICWLIPMYSDNV